LKKFLLKVRNVVAFVVLGAGIVVFFWLLAIMAGVEWLIMLVALPFRTLKRGLLALGRGFFISGTKKISKMPGMSVKSIDEEKHEQVS